MKHAHTSERTTQKYIRYVVRLEFSIHRIDRFFSCALIELLENILFPFVWADKEKLLEFTDLLKLPHTSIILYALTSHGHFHRC